MIAKKLVTARATPPFQLGFILSEEQHHNICAHFGCGKHLSLREGLFGKYCVNHGARKTEISVKLKYQ